MELSRRALSVLCAVVELYIRSGEPIASKMVAHHSGLGLSSATMRNVMAENSWVMRPYLQTVGHYQASLKKHPNPPPANITVFE